MTAERIRAQLAGHGGPATAVVEHLGRVGYRVVVVAADGHFTDAVVSDEKAATDLAVAVGAQVGGWDRETSARLTVSARDRRQMAGTGR